MQPNHLPKLEIGEFSTFLVSLIYLLFILIATID